MSPWDVLGWLLVFPVFLVGMLVLGYVIRIVIALGEFTAGEVKIYRKNRLRKRANAGKVRCQLGDCPNTATRRTPRGYFCETHYSHRNGSFGLSYAFRLDHAKSQEDK